MAEPLLNKINQSLQSAEGMYHRLVLLVGKSGSGKTRILRDAAEKFGTPVINVNLSLANELLELTAKQRLLRLPVILEEVIRCKEQDAIISSLNHHPLQPAPILLDNTEILFDMNLKQDPLRLLQGISRNRAIVASWNGTMTSGRLLYAEAGHPEYRCYDTVDALIVGMDGTATVDAAKKQW